MPLVTQGSYINVSSTINDSGRGIFILQNGPTVVGNFGTINPINEFLINTGSTVTLSQAIINTTNNGDGNGGIYGWNASTGEGVATLSIYDNASLSFPKNPNLAIQITNSANLTLTGNTTHSSTASIDGDAAGNGTLSLVPGTGNTITLSGTVGATSPLAAIQMGEGSVNAQQAINLTNGSLTFTGNTNLNLNDIPLAADYDYNGFTPTITGTITGSFLINAFSHSLTENKSTNVRYTGTSAYNVGSYTSTGNLDFNGNDGTLELAGGTFIGDLDNTGLAGYGNISVTSNNTSNITGTIGGANYISSILVDTGTLTTGNGVNAIIATIENNGSFTPGGNLNSDVTFGNDGGTYNLGGNSLSGNVDFAGNNGNVSSIGGTIYGALDNSSIITNAGIINVGEGTTNISGMIGATNFIASIIVNTGTLTTESIINADNTTIEGGGTFNPGDNMGGNVAFGSGGGTFNLTSYSQAGDLDFAGNGGTVNISGGSIDGNVYSSSSVSGILSFGAGSSSVTGTIGGANPISSMLVSIGTLTTSGTVRAANTNIAGGIWNPSENVETNLAFGIEGGTYNLAVLTHTGDIDFSGNNGSVTVTGDASIFGNIDNSSSATPSGTLTTGDLATITGSIGSTNPISSFIINSGRTTTSGIVNAQTITLNAGGNYIPSGDVTGDVIFIQGYYNLNNIIHTGNLNFTSGEDSTLTLNSSTITGSLDMAGDDLFSRIEVGPGISNINGLVGAISPMSNILIDAGTLNTFSTVVTSEVYIKNGGAFIPSATVQGNIFFGDGEGTLVVGSQTVDLVFVGNSSNAVISLAGGTIGGIRGGAGTLNVGAGTSIVSGTIGEGAVPLSYVNIDSGQLSTGDSVNVTTTTIKGGGIFVPGGNMTGNVIFDSEAGTLALAANALTGSVDFAGNAGTVTIAGGTISSTVNSTLSTGGTLSVTSGTSTITGAIGSNNPIAAINLTTSITFQ